MTPKKFLILICLSSLGLLPNAQAKKQVGSTALQKWMQDLPIPTAQPLYLVVKGYYPTREKAQKTQSFITQLMGTTPPDEVDSTAGYPGLPAGKYFIGTLFDSRERAQWWINFSYRNRQVPKGEIIKVVLKKPSQLPYMPDPQSAGEKRLLTQSEALSKVQQNQDIQVLSKKKKLVYKFTDFPRNGDLRYEIEVLENRGSGKDPMMVDFFMVSALDGEITERFSETLGKAIVPK